jgi:hypothetical protein
LPNLVGRRRFLLKKIWSAVVKYSKVVVGVFMLILVLVIYIYGVAILYDKKLLQDAIPVNTLGITVGLLSLPSIIDSFFALILNKKKSFKGECECPNCGSKLAIKIIEED